MSESTVNYGELKDFILTDTHRSDMSDDDAAGFVRRAEGLIRRMLVGYDLTATLDESDRVALGVYTLPDSLLMLRAVFGTFAGEEYRLTDAGLVNIKNMPDDITPVYYAIHGSTIEFRGVPGTDAAFTLKFFGHPDAFTADGDENDLLTDHEEIYIAGAEHYLYLREQDMDMAGDAYGRFETAIESLNEAHGRKIGGGGTAGGYNLGNFSVGSGY